MSLFHNHTVGDNGHHIDVYKRQILQALLIITIPRMVSENAKRGVIIQAIYRSNFVLFGIPLTANLFGDEGAVLASMMVAIVIPVYNATAVIICLLYTSRCV